MPQWAAAPPRLRSALRAAGGGARGAWRQSRRAGRPRRNRAAGAERAPRSRAPASGWDRTLLGAWRGQSLRKVTVSQE
eukprot:4518908-Prymnesium_polylepis.1